MMNIVKKKQTCQSQRKILWKCLKGFAIERKICLYIVPFKHLQTNMLHHGQVNGLFPHLEYSILWVKSPIWSNQLL